MKTKEYPIKELVSFEMDEKKYGGRYKINNPKIVS